MPKLAVVKGIRNFINIRPMKEGTEVSKIEAHQTAWPALCRGAEGHAAEMRPKAICG